MECSHESSELLSSTAVDCQAIDLRFNENPKNNPSKPTSSGVLQTTEYFCNTQWSGSINILQDEPCPLRKRDRALCPWLLPLQLIVFAPPLRPENYLWRVWRKGRGLKSLTFLVQRPLNFTCYVSIAVEQQRWRVLPICYMRHATSSALLIMFLLRLVLQLKFKS